MFNSKMGGTFPYTAPELAIVMKHMIDSTHGQPTSDEEDSDCITESMNDLNDKLDQMEINDRIENKKY